MVQPRDSSSSFADDYGSVDLREVLNGLRFGELNGTFVIKIPSASPTSVLVSNAPDFDVNCFRDGSDNTVVVTVAP